MRRAPCKKSGSRVVYTLLRQVAGDMLEVFRVVRILKIARYNPDSTVLFKALSLSARALAIPVVFVLIGAFFFGAMHQPRCLAFSIPPRACVDSALTCRPWGIRRHHLLRGAHRAGDPPRRPLGRLSFRRHRRGHLVLATPCPQRDSTNKIATVACADAKSN